MIKRLSPLVLLSALALGPLCFAQSPVAVTPIEPPKTTTWRAGIGGGFGGAGIQKQVVQADGSGTVVERSESPGTIHFFAERLIEHNRVLSVEHARGFRLGPFSSGVGFTSVSVNWHYMSPAPDVRKDETKSFFFVKNWSPYLGYSGGIAEGRISREGDLNPTIASSGVFFGIRNGVDYLLNPDLGLKIEINYSTSFFQAQTAPAKMTFFALWAGLFIPAF